MPTVATSIRLPQDLYDWLKSKAEKEHRTVSNTLIAILTDAKDADVKLKNASITVITVTAKTAITKVKAVVYSTSDRNEFFSAI